MFSNHDQSVMNPILSTMKSHGEKLTHKAAGFCSMTRLAILLPELNGIQLHARYPQNFP